MTATNAGAARGFGSSYDAIARHYARRTELAAIRVAIRATLEALDIRFDVHVSNALASLAAAERILETEADDDGSLQNAAK